VAQAGLPDLSDSQRAALPPDGGETYNRLVFEGSPYLLQHARNPVDWHPWGNDAFELAASLDRPVLVSIGYSTCHWCHVMAHECFDDTEVAEVLNRLFVCVKVDREERPDIDDACMAVCQMMTGSGGWPLTLVMTPDQQPFFAATYLPKHSRGGHMGLIDLAERIDTIWHQDRDRIIQTGQALTNALRKMETPGDRADALDGGLLDRALSDFRQRFDRRNGGFGGAPKFPTPHNLSLLLRIAKRSGDDDAAHMAMHTLRRMRMGGIFDHLGFGLHRYSVDGEWLVPHFEKMLYDQATTLLACVDAWQFSGQDVFARMAAELIEYVLRDLRDPEGGFHCGEDADSEGAEGTFYVWDAAELESILGADDAAVVARVFGVTPEGNFEGRNILHLRTEPADVSRFLGMAPDELHARLEACRVKLFQARGRRPRPHLDDKVLTCWNGLMVGAMARAGAAMGRRDWVAEATRAGEFLVARMRDDAGRLLRRYRKGVAGIPGFLDDYAFLAFGLTELYLAGFETRFLATALDRTRDMLALFDDGRDGLFETGHDSVGALGRGRSVHDNALPTGSSVAALNLIRIGRLCGNDALETLGEALLRSLIPRVGDVPQAFGQGLIALDMALGPREEIVLAVPDGADPGEVEAMLKVARAGFRPHLLIQLRPIGDSIVDSLCPHLSEKISVDGRVTAYYCVGRTCKVPAVDPKSLELELENATNRRTGSRGSTG
jgi:hypothetical protein